MIISFIRSFLRFIFFSRARESLSNCMDIIAITYDFLSAESKSDKLVVSLLIFPFMIPSSSTTLLLSLSTFSFALKILIKSIIWMRSFYLYFGSSQFISISATLLKKLEAIETVEASFARSINWV